MKVERIWRMATLLACSGEVENLSPLSLWRSSPSWPFAPTAPPRSTPRSPTSDPPASSSRLRHKFEMVDGMQASRPKFEMFESLFMRYIHFSCSSSSFRSLCLAS
ncbi:hypothetical protein PVAP13_9NG489928 [Panicum virgatum]|uniref:Uncharacterized protein n=1 Tax=Panicum virgatum TaxID=38727 RepID=A0A8T0MR88_PANVG|nr:hypothetical protein PVAP13_9NG489928 [Panicum virgatum]